MVTGYVVKLIKYLKQQPPQDGLSKSISPDTMINGKVAPTYKEIQKLSFGDYVQAYKLKDKTNTDQSRTVRAIALYLSGNKQGGCSYY